MSFILCLTICTPNCQHLTTSRSWSWSARLCD